MAGLCLARPSFRSFGQTRSELVEALADVHWRLDFLTGQITVLRGQIESLRLLVASRSEDTDPALPRSFLDTLD